MTIVDRMYSASLYLKQQLMLDAPYKSGNLALNGIRLIQDKAEYHIVVGGEIADYAIYTNENWDEFESPLKGKQNPNEGWIERCIEKSKPMMIRILSGSITQEELNKEYSRQRLKIKAREDKREKILRLQEQKLREKVAQ